MTTDHRKVFGAGFHAGMEAAEGSRPTSNLPTAAEMVLYWNPGTAEVALFHADRRSSTSDRYLMSGLAAYTEIRNASYEKRKLTVFIEAMHLIIRDKCDPTAVHRALLGLREYRDGLSDDMPTGE